MSLAFRSATGQRCICAVTNVYIHIEQIATGHIGADWAVKGLGVMSDQLPTSQAL